MIKTQRQRKSELHEAVESFYSADYDYCEGVLDTLPPSAGRDFLRARVLLRRQKFVEVVPLLAQLSKGLSKSEEIEKNVLLGAAYGFTKDFEQGLRLIGPALTARSINDALRGDALYYSGVIHWMRFDNARAEATASELLTTSDPNHRARANILLSWISVGRQEISASAGFLQKALENVASASRPDTGVLANALFALAVLCREVFMPTVTARVKEVAKSIQWTSTLATQRFHITRALGWIDALDGDYLGAFRQLRAASLLAPSEPWRIVSILDRAYLAQSTGETAFAIDQFHDAEEMSRSVQWSQTQGEERTALVMLAEISAPIDPVAATTYLAQFRSLQTSMAPNLPYESDMRSRAFEAYSTGLVYSRLGDAEQGKKLLMDAWNIFTAFKYEWRAALAAHHLFVITGEAAWRHQSVQQISPYPKSWIADLIGKGEDAASALPLERLTPAQKQIFTFLAQGLSTNNIAEKVGRSPNTVRNHLRDMYQVLNVRNRSDLLSKLR